MSALRLIGVLLPAFVAIAALHPIDAPADDKKLDAASAAFQIRAAYRVPREAVARSRELAGLAILAVKEATRQSGSKKPVLTGIVIQSRAGDKYGFSATTGGLTLWLNSIRRYTFQISRFEADLSRPVSAAIAADHHLQFTVIETDAKGRKGPEWKVESRRATPPRGPKSFSPSILRGKEMVLAVEGKLAFDGVECNVKLRMQGQWSQPIGSGREEITDLKLAGTIGMPSQTIAVSEQRRHAFREFKTQRGRIITDHTRRTITSKWTSRNGTSYRFADTVIAGGHGSGNVPARIGVHVAGKVFVTRPGRKSETEIGAISLDKSRRVVLTLKDAAGGRVIVLDPKF
jgi:hypothetical protein